MATITDTTPETFGELLEQLGGTPPERILLKPAPGTATEADVLAAAERPRKRLCELIDGVLAAKTEGIWESQLAAYFAYRMNAFVVPRKLGIITGPDGPMRLQPGLVRMPDVAFISWDSLDDEQPDENPILAVAPDIAIEILSKSNTRREMERKRRDYFDAGARVVWEVDIPTRSVHEYLPDGSERTFNAVDTLSVESILPGFKLSIAEVFASRERPTC